ncbi:hypothetical protein [Achromobacter sp. UMC71]|uniref:hypothetical protein n=1 Tax=Achromobacter sp. UMC71 TaxID=1862320 RepID=UPI00160176C7|nr:hypothetical protein [Achromobacter sp. UMC71]
MKAHKSDLAKQLLKNPSTARALRLAVEQAVSAQTGSDRPRSSFMLNDDGKRQKVSVEVVPVAA